MTLVIVSGWLLTVANIGDSDAYLDTGSEAVQLTFSHRIQASGPLWSISDPAGAVKLSATANGHHT